MKTNNPFSKQNILILIPLILVMILDLTFTLVGQPESYWYNYKFFNEGSPLGPVLMSYHPGYFILFFVFYLLFVLFLATNLPRPLNIIVAIGFFLGHAWGSSSWMQVIIYRFLSIRINEWYSVIGYFVIIAIISGFCINQWLKTKNS